MLFYCFSPYKGIPPCTAPFAIEASILRKVQEELKNHPEAEKDQIFDRVFNSVCAKCKQYPPLAGLDVLASNEIQCKWKKILKIEAAKVLS